MEQKHETQAFVKLEADLLTKGNPEFLNSGRSFVRWHTLIILVVCILLYFLMSMVPETVRVFRWGGRFVVGVLGLFVWLYVFYRPRRRFVARLETLEHRVCLRCGYALVSLPARHRCPECGLNYDIDDVRRVWKEWMDRFGQSIK